MRRRCNLAQGSIAEAPPVRGACSTVWPLASFPSRASRRGRKAEDLTALHLLLLRAVGEEKFGREGAPGALLLPRARGIPPPPGRVDPVRRDLRDRLARGSGVGEWRRRRRAPHRGPQGRRSSREWLGAGRRSGGVGWRSREGHGARRRPFGRRRRRHRVEVDRGVRGGWMDVRETDGMRERVCGWGWTRGGVTTSWARTPEIINRIQSKIQVRTNR